MLIETIPIGTVSGQYDFSRRRTRLIHPDEFFLTYSHLRTGEMSAIRENGASGTPLIGFGFDNVGRRISLSRIKGAATSSA